MIFLNINSFDIFNNKVCFLSYIYHYQIDDWSRVKLIRHYSYILSNSCLHINENATNCRVTPPMKVIFQLPDKFKRWYIGPITSIFLAILPHEIYTFFDIHHSEIEWFIVLNLFTIIHNSMLIFHWSKISAITLT